MAVITISREAASGGDEIAQEVATALGSDVVDKAFMERVLDQYGFIEFGDEYDSKLGFWDRLDVERGQRRQSMMRLLKQATLAVAQRKDVLIKGRMGFAVLGGYADVLSVRIQAPEEARAARMAATRGISLADATAEVRQIGKVRAAFVKRFYEVDWYDSRGFDLVVDTATIPAPMAVRFILDAAGALDGADLAGRTTTADADVDPVAVSAVEDEFREIAVTS